MGLSNSTPVPKILDMSAGLEEEDEEEEMHSDSSYGYLHAFCVAAQNRCL